jgi:hypothetical protein
MKLIFFFFPSSLNPFSQKEKRKFVFLSVSVYSGFLSAFGDLTDAGDDSRCD